MPGLVSSSASPGAHTASGLSLRYADAVTAAARLAGNARVLGVVGYGGLVPGAVAPSRPFVQAPLLPAAGGPYFEIWEAACATSLCRTGMVSGAYGDGLAFGAVDLADVPGGGLEEVVELAYDAIFDFLDETGCTEPVRFWNYLAAITDDDQGMERYRRFNIGRHRAYLARLRQSVPPAASCLGAVNGGSMIYFLAAREAAEAIENPRQMSAYAYPPVYGPCSPSFSRAGRLGAALFISGTASITGHETRHRGDLTGQVAETMENLRALIGNAGMTAGRGQDWAFKTYLRDPLYQAAIEPALDAMFGPECQKLYLTADICRTDLLMEIEAFHSP